MATSRSQRRALEQQHDPERDGQDDEVQSEDGGPQDDLAGIRAEQHPRHCDRVRDHADREPQPDVRADDLGGTVGVRSDDVAQHDPAELQVGDEPDDPEQRDDERELAPLDLGELPDDDDRARPAEGRDHVAPEDQDARRR